MSDSTCDCPEPDLCRQLGRHMNGSLYHLYQTSPKYREHFESQAETRRAAGGLGKLRRIPDGPGTKLKDLLDSYGIFPREGCGCEQMVDEMNLLGVDGCRRKRSRLVSHLRTNARKRSWGEWYAVGKRIRRESWFSHLDPFGSLVDEAIRRAETKEKQ